MVALEGAQKLVLQGLLPPDADVDRVERASCACHGVCNAIRFGLDQLAPPVWRTIITTMRWCLGKLLRGHWYAISQHRLNRKGMKLLGLYFHRFTGKPFSVEAVGSGALMCLCEVAYVFHFAVCHAAGVYNAVERFCELHETIQAVVNEEVESCRRAGKPQVASRLLADVVRDLGAPMRILASALRPLLHATKVCMLG